MMDNRYIASAALLIRHVYLILSGLQFLMFYFFIENSTSIKPPRMHLVVISLLLGLEVLGFLSYNLFYQPNSPDNLAFLNFFRTLGRIGYNGLGIYIFLILSLPIYVK